MTNWSTHKADSIFGNEMSIAEDKSCHHFVKPHPAFEWLAKNKAQDILFSALDACCPLFPLASYNGVISSYLSPPPSGTSSAAFIVIGRDPSKKIRAVGSNKINPNHCSLNPPIVINFFEAFDAANCPDDKEELIRSEVFRKMSKGERELLDKFDWEAHKYGTMPVVLMVLTGKNALFGIETAHIKKNGACDFSYEFLGEVHTPKKENGAGKSPKKDTTKS